MNQSGNFLLFVIITLVLIGSLDTTPIAEAQKLTIPEIPRFEFSQDKFLKAISPDVDFQYRVSAIGEDLREFLTFNPTEKAELKLQHAKIQQDKINNLDLSGNQIPLELEERRINKINEATNIINTELHNQEDPKTTNLFDEILILKEMGEINDIRILYSQLPEVVNADQQTKDEFNAKVNSLDTWQNECFGEFDIDTLTPLNTAIPKIQSQCPKLIEYEEKFGLERIRVLISGTI